MARVIPDGWRELAVTGAAQREIETLGRLAASLPDGYTVFHGVHWTNLERGYAVFGEADFVVVNRAGDLLVIEQKSGFLAETAEGLVKTYAGRSKSVAVQMARTRDALLTKLRARQTCSAVRVDSLLYCPDYRVRTPATAGLVPERIVDAGRREQLAAILQEILPLGEDAPQAREVHRFLQDIIQLETDVSALMGRARALVTRVSGGLAHWARQLEMSPFRLRVTGTAGSGKTQLALAEYRQAIDRGQRPLYVCFNRPLADHFAAIAPTGGLASSFHMLCDRRLRAAGQVPDFSRPDAFEQLVADAAALPDGEGDLFDTLIVDEGQDFPESWRDLVLRHARPAARVLWLEDPLQNLYGRPPVPLPGWIGLRAVTNYRSPRPVVRLLRTLLDEGTPLEAASPFDGGEIDVLTYGSGDEMLHKVREAIRQCYAAGFRKEDVALVSYHGRESSYLLRHDQLGSHRLRSFTGRYDLLGQPVFTEGELLAESVFRFKGQSAPAVVFTEIDFAELDDKALRRLFVGATRATLRLTLVMAEPSARLLAAHLE
jgi:hypothetical protein